jgi:hypothetical protein
MDRTPFRDRMEPPRVRSRRRYGRDSRDCARCYAGRSRRRVCGGRVDAPPLERIEARFARPHRALAVDAKVFVQDLRRRIAPVDEGTQPGPEPVTEKPAHVVGVEEISLHARALEKAHAVLVVAAPGVGHREVTTKPIGDVPGDPRIPPQSRKRQRQPERGESQGPAGGGRPRRPGRECFPPGAQREQQCEGPHPQEPDRRQQRHDRSQSDTGEHGVDPAQRRRRASPQQPNESECRGQREERENRVGRDPRQRCHGLVGRRPVEGLEAGPLVAEAPQARIPRGRPERQVLLEAPRVRTGCEQTQTQRRREAPGAGRGAFDNGVGGVGGLQDPSEPRVDTHAQECREHEQPSHREQRVHVRPDAEQHRRRAHARPGGRRPGLDEKSVEEQGCRDAHQVGAQLPEPVPRQHQKERGGKAGGDRGAALAPKDRPRQRQDPRHRQRVDDPEPVEADRAVEPVQGDPEQPLVRRGSILVGRVQQRVGRQPRSLFGVELAHLGVEPEVGGLDGTTGHVHREHGKQQQGAPREGGGDHALHRGDGLHVARYASRAAGRRAWNA